MTKQLSLFSLLFVHALCGCGELDNCADEAAAEVEITTGTTAPEARMYWSVPWDGPRDHFPAKTMMRFRHDLGTTPELVMSYLSFTPTGTSLSENAGNQGLIRCVDNTDIWLKNDTCEESFYVRVAAWASGTSDAPCTCEERFANACD